MSENSCFRISRFTETFPLISVGFGWFRLVSVGFGSFRLFSVVFGERGSGRCLKIHVFAFRASQRHFRWFRLVSVGFGWFR